MTVTVLDGGMGQELLKRSSRPPEPLWSANVLASEPHLVVDAHRAFLEAGADVITLSSYSATPTRLRRHSQEDRFTALQQAAVDAAATARRQFHQAGAQRPIRIAGCLPPLAASYNAAAVPSAEACREQYDDIVACQAEGVDLFLCETQSTIREATAAAEAATATGKPVWLSFTVQDSLAEKEPRLRSGERLCDALEAVAHLPLDAVLLNCSFPEAISHALPTVAQHAETVGAYGNGFTSVAALNPNTTVQALKTRDDLSPQMYTKHAQHWVDQGAAIVGGCCEIGPEHIRHLASALNQHP